MFGKNKNNSNVSHDIDVMMQMMDKVIQGEYDEIDVTAFDNPVYGDAPSGTSLPDRHLQLSDPDVHIWNEWSAAEHQYCL